MAGSRSIGTPRAARRSRTERRSPTWRNRRTGPDACAVDAPETSRKPAAEEEDVPALAPLAPLAVDGQAERLLVEAQGALEIAWR
jgi:hypothetical protein